MFRKRWPPWAVVLIRNTFRKNNWKPFTISATSNTINWVTLLSSKLYPVNIQSLNNSILQSMSNKYQHIKEEAYAANMELPKLNLVIFTFGNVSAVDRS